MTVKYFRQRWLNLSIWMWLAILFALLISYGFHFLHLDDRLYYWIKTHNHADEWQSRSVWLPGYKVNIDAKQVVGIDGELSGLAYDPDHKLLWAVTNNPMELFALDTAGEVQGQYRLDGFSDVEAVAYTGNDTLIIAEERLQSLTMIHLPHQEDGELLQNGWLSKSEFSGLVLDMGSSGNKGYEGLDYDLKGDRLFITKERDPMQIIEVSDFQKNLNLGLFPEIHNHSELVDSNLFSRDLSSIVLDQETGHLILLSDESQLLIEMTDKGEVVSFRSLSMGFAGLKSSIRQAEGVTLDEEGNLFVVSEPNLFYRFERP